MLRRHWWVVACAVLVSACSGLPSPPDGGMAADGEAAMTSPPAQILYFGCRAHNIAALAIQDPGMSVDCSAQALDAQGNMLPSAHIRFLAEAGVIREKGSTNDPLYRYAYYPHQGAVAMPADVAPFAGEPHWTDDANRIHNPRDGLATLVAYVEGDNQPLGDMFDGDPFVDLNDNDKYDEGEPYVSASGDPMAPYNPMQSTLIWRQIKIVWTGTVSTNPLIAKVQPVSGSDFDLARGAHEAIQFQLVDDNFNALAANDPAHDAIQWTVTPLGAVIVSAGAGSPKTTPMANTYGINIDVIHDCKIVLPNDVTSYLLDSLYRLSLTNARPASDMAGPETYSVCANLSRTGTIDETGQPADVLTSEKLCVSGTLQ